MDTALDTPIDTPIDTLPGFPSPTLRWSAALALDLPVMDETHEEFVELLAQVERAGDDTLVDRWRTLVEHTSAHFAREDEWMRQTRFSSTNCHAMQHKVVLQVMREGLARGEQGDPSGMRIVRTMAHELAIWFPQHAQSMDAALALHLRRVGHDPVTGQVLMPDALPLDLIQGCGGASCAGPDPGARSA